MKDSIKGKILLKGKIQCLSPLHIGCGSKDRSDLDVLLDPENLPFIPATSFVGVLHHSLHFRDNDLERYQKEWGRFWGYIRNQESQQSSFRCSDLMCLSQVPLIRVRDGIKIDNKTGLVKEQGKYDYEIVERGTFFGLNMEFHYRESDETFVKKMVRTLYDMLGNGEIQIGGKTNSGLGKIKLIGEETKLYDFDFSRKDHVVNWLTENHKNQMLIPETELGEPFELGNNMLSINADLELKNSLIIRSYCEEPEMPDATHLQSLGDWIISGSSLKGGIRARAEKIVNTLGKPDLIIKNLFGYVDEDQRSKNAKKGKIQVKETILPRFLAELQTRIKIDRLTGGTIETALFDTMPLFTDFKDKVLKISINVKNCTDTEAGLLLLVLKDLWTGDLAVGGEKSIGRGVFQGIKAVVEYNDKQTVIDKDFTLLSMDERNRLQSYVNALNSEAL